MTIDKVATIVQAAGGVGLFLLGMIVMTDGLRQLAGDAMRASLMRFTSNPLSGALTGATATAILQSSSATTVAAVGFVEAGLISFPGALGIIFGANIGTTITGWLVALIGLKLKLGAVMLPLVLVGSIMRLFANSRAAWFGIAMAGFGLIFVGISVMQEAMSGLQNIIDPDNLPMRMLSTKFLLVFVGILVTVITQSSSAGVAAALTALYAGAIQFEQAAALVIGMDIGTTVTAAMATIGRSVAARRTGFSHVIYNLLTGFTAIFLITPYIMAWEAIAPGQLALNAEIALAGFHTAFNALGVVAVLPFTVRFARLIEKLVPELEPTYTRLLDEALLDQPHLALNAVQATINEELTDLLNHIDAILSNDKAGKRSNLDTLQMALDETQAYIDCIHLDATDGGSWERLIAMIHTLDHLQRLHERCEEEEDRAITARNSKVLKQHCDLLTQTIEKLIHYIQTDQYEPAARIAETTRSIIHDHVEPYRKSTVSKVGRGEYNVRQGTEQAEAVRWLNRVSKHIAHIAKHYKCTILATGN